MRLRWTGGLNAATETARHGGGRILHPGRFEGSPVEDQRFERALFNPLSSNGLDNIAGRTRQVNRNMI